MVRTTGRLPSDKLVDVNTIIGDKMILAGNGWPIHDTYHEIVIRSSTQCLPTVKFDRALLNHEEGRQCVQCLQDSICLTDNRYLFALALSRARVMLVYLSYRSCYYVSIR